MPKNKKSVEKNKKKEEEKLYAFLTTFLSIIGFVIYLVSWRKNKYVTYYAKQSLVIFIIGVIAGILQSIVKHMATIGELINVALGVLVFIIWLMSWIYALSGEKKEIPIIGEWAKKIKL